MDKKGNFEAQFCLRRGDGDGTDEYSNGGCIVDICLIAEQIEVPMRVERGVLSIIWQACLFCFNITTSSTVEVDMIVGLSDRSQMSSRRAAARHTHHSPLPTKQPSCRRTDFCAMGHSLVTPEINDSHDSFFLKMKNNE